MKIKRVIASDFGCLSGSYELFDDRANVIVEENERGKSTFVAAILAGLYGFPPSRERKTIPEEEAYQPWKGGEYRVSLEVLDADQRPLLIERDFTKGTVKVTDLSTNKDMTQEFRAGKRDFLVGERLLGFSREIFGKTCLVRQLEVDALGDTKELQSKVEAIFDTSAGRGTAAKAMDVLHHAIRKYHGVLQGEGWVEGEIDLLKKEIAGREKRIRELIEEREKAAPGMVRLRELRKRLKTLEGRREQLEYLTRKAEIAETELALEEDEKNRNDLQRLIKQKESLKQYSDFPKEKAAEFQRLVGRQGELRKQTTNLEGSLARVKQDTEKKKLKLKEFPGFEALGEDFRTRLHDLSTDLKRLSEEAERKQKELSDFEESLRKDGYDLSEMKELCTRFSRVTVEEKDLLRDSESRIPQIEAHVARLEAEERRCRDELRAAKKPAKLLSYAALALLIAGVAWATLSGDSARWIGAVIGLAGFSAVAAAFVVRLLTLRAVQRLLREEGAARDERKSLLSVREMLSRTLAEIARRASFGTVEELSEAFKRWGRLADRAARLESLRKEAAEVEERVVACKGRAAEELKRMGVHLPAAEVDIAVLQKAEKRLGEYLGTVSSLNELEESRRKQEGEVANVDAEEKEVRQSVRDILTAASLPQDLPLEEAQPKVEEARDKSQEFHRLTTVEIPDRERRLLSSETVEAMRQRLQSLQPEIERMLARDPELAGLPVTRKHSEYEDEAREVAREISQNTEERGGITRQVQNVEDKYHQEYPRLANELAELRRTLDRTERFQGAVNLAIGKFQDISKRSHTFWASALNPRANEILKHLNPRCRELKFDRDLSFTVVPDEGYEPLSKEKIQAQQSVGARHQIYLAVRLALADYLSSGGSVPQRASLTPLEGASRAPRRAPPGGSEGKPRRLPVILDDPFATSDDDRFLSGMKFLCREFRRNHQLIILTCHRQRHSDLLRQKAPDLLEEIRIVRIAPPP